MRNAILISIHPNHIENILSGSKVFEYRKIMPIKDISHLVLYCTAPIQKIVAVAEVVECLQGSPAQIWSKTAFGGGITYKYFREYFSGKNHASSFTLGNVYKLFKSLELNELHSCKVPPQSFCYLSDSDTQKIIDNVNMIPSVPSSLIFVGGIHGVGKTTICQKAFSPLGYQCTSASSLISSYGQKHKNKKTTHDISKNQTILIKQLKLESDRYCRLVLDGHFTLINNKYQIKPIHLSVFQEIKPNKLLLLKGEPSEIVDRLAKRDNKYWDLTFLSEFQTAEEEHAKYISTIMGIPLLVFNDSIRLSKLAKLIN